MVDLSYGNYAISEEMAQKLMQRVAELDPKLIVEFGSGTSTYLLADYASHNDAKLISLEHLAEYAAKTRALCEGLPIDIRVVDLTAKHHSLPGEIDFVLIDGPYGWHGNSYVGRLNTLPSVWSKLSDSFEVWLDDANRDHEQWCLESWTSNYPINVELVGEGKGLAVITRA